VSADDVRVDGRGENPRPRALRWSVVVVPALALALAVAWLARGPNAEASTTVEDVLSSLTPPDTVVGFLGGVALGLYFESEDVSYLPYLWEIASTGSNAVSIVVSWSQPDIAASDIRPDRPRTVPDDVLRRTIREAASLDLEVMLFPILWIDERGPGEWRGALAPDDVDAWFESYRTFIVHYATIAEAEGVALFSLGSELGTMERHADAWTDLAASVRDVYSGPITYSANWDHYDRTPFWGDVDFIGITAYHELTHDASQTPPMAEVLDMWGPIVWSVERLATEHQRPVIITELGYVSQTSAARYPWDYTRRGEVDLHAQFELYLGAYLAWSSSPMLHGVFFWNWFGDGGHLDNGYTPRGKPAEHLIRWWFQDLRARAQR